MKKKGMPARRFIRVHEDKISEVVNDKSFKILTTCDKKNERQAVKNFNGKNNIVNNNIKEEIENIYNGDFFESLPDEPVTEVIAEKEEMFEQFWKAYPQCFRKTNKKGCKTKFLKIEKSVSLFY